MYTYIHPVYSNQIQHPADRYIFNNGYSVIYRTPVQSVNYEGVHNQFRQAPQSLYAQPVVVKPRVKPDTKEILTKKLSEKTLKITQIFKRLEEEKFSTEERRVKMYISLFSDILTLIDKVGNKHGCFFDYREFYIKSRQLYDWVKENLSEERLYMVDFFTYFQDKIVSYFF